MDMYAFRFANALVGNTASAAGLEFAIQGMLHHVVHFVLSGSARRCACASKHSASDVLKAEHASAAGPTVKFHVAAVVALTGAEFDAKLDDKPVPCWTSFAVAAGTTLAIGMVTTVCLPASCHASSLETARVFQVEAPPNLQLHAAAGRDAGLPGSEWRTGHAGVPGQPGHLPRRQARRRTGMRLYTCHGPSFSLLYRASRAQSV
jgi:Carboxyltransferase domain, subdomain A and B